MPKGASIVSMTDRRSDNQPDLSAKVALVTGASRGVGRGIAEGLAASKATVYATGRSIKLNPPSGCAALACDHTNDQQVQTVVNEIINKQRRIDILVNNVWGGYERMVEDGRF